MRWRQEKREQEIKSGEEPIIATYPISLSNKKKVPKEQFVRQTYLFSDNSRYGLNVGDQSGRIEEALLRYLHWGVVYVRPFAFSFLHIFVYSVKLLLAYHCPHIDRLERQETSVKTRTRCRQKMPERRITITFNVTHDITL